MENCLRSHILGRGDRLENVFLAMSIIKTFSKLCRDLTEDRKPGLKSMHVV